MDFAVLWSRRRHGPAFRRSIPPRSFDTSERDGSQQSCPAFSYRDMQALLEARSRVPEASRRNLSIGHHALGTSGGPQASSQRRVTIRSLNLILEAVSEIAPLDARNRSQNMSASGWPQICDELVVNGAIPVIQARRALGSGLPEAQTRPAGRDGVRRGSGDGRTIPRARPSASSATR